MLIAGTDHRIVLVLGGALALGVAYTAYKVHQNKSKLAEAINPLSANNLVYRGVNSVGEAITGDSNFSLGVWAWEVLNPGKVAEERRALNTNPERSQGLEEPWVSPSSPFGVGA
jgi:hypothetical protein